MSKSARRSAIENCESLGFYAKKTPMQEPRLCCVFMDIALTHQFPMKQSNGHKQYYSGAFSRAFNWA
jgi:hypothetical protein